MFTSEEPMTLDNIKEGAAVEMFNMELQRVLDDMANPNKEKTATRSVNLTVSFKPDKTREDIVIVSVDCKSNLAKQTPCLTSAIVGRTGKTGHIREINDGQGNLFSTGGEVVDISTGEIQS